MAYIINKTDGTALTTITDGTINNTTSLTLIGKSYSGFGELLNENLVKLLENSSSTSAPVAPLRGEIWFDTNTNQLKVYDGSTFKPTGGAKAQANAPSSPSTGDLWADTDDDQLYLWTGTTWQLVGPVYSKGQTLSGFKIETINDNTAVSRVIASMYSGNIRVAVLSTLGFTPGAAMSGFAQIYAGITLNSTLGAQFAGTTTAATQLDISTSYSNNGDLIAGKNFLRKDVAQTTQGAITIDDDAGIIIGENQEGSITVDASDHLIIANTSEDKNISFRIDNAGTDVEAITIDGDNSRVGIFTTAPTVPFEITGNVKITGNLSVSGEYENTTSNINIVDDAFVKLNTGNAEVNSGIIVETSDTDDARLFYDVTSNHWSAGENATYSQIIRLADATTDGHADNTKVLKTTGAGNVKVTTLTLVAVGANIATTDTSNLNVPTIGQTAESIKRWGGSFVTDDNSNSIAGNRYVEIIAPTSGQGSNGDLWFVRET
jgi:hypothetical protein